MVSNSKLVSESLFFDFRLIFENFWTNFGSKNGEVELEELLPDVSRSQADGPRPLFLELRKTILIESPLKTTLETILKRLWFQE